MFIRKGKALQNGKNPKPKETTSVETKTHFNDEPEIQTIYIHFAIKEKEKLEVLAIMKNLLSNQLIKQLKTCSNVNVILCRTGNTTL